MGRLETVLGKLAGFEPRRGRISLFLDLDPSTVPTAAALESHITSLVDEARRALEERADGDHETLVTERADVDRIAAFLENDFDRADTAGLALYVSGADDVWEEVRLPRSVEDAAHVGRAFVLAPLLDSLEHDRALVLAAVGRDRGSLWRLRNGRTRPLDDLSRDGQGQHDQGGWSQARYARSRDNEAAAHLQQVAEAIGDEIAPGSDTLLVVACLEEQRPIFEEQLPAHVREALLGWTTIEAHADDEALRPEAERLLDERLQAERTTLLDRWREEAPARRAASTWEKAIPAASDGRVEVTLVDGRTREAWECPVCGRGYVSSGSCELDGTPLAETVGGALELVVRGTLRSGGSVRFAPGSLGETEGVATILRY